MPTGVQLSQLLTDLRSEIGHSVNVAHGQNTREIYEHLLRRTQEQLAVEVDWPQLRGRVTQQLTAGSRFYNEHPKMSWQNINRAYLDIGNRFRKLIYGIDTPDIKLDENGEPIRNQPERYDYNGEFKQIEFYPVPAVDEIVVYEGTINLDPLIASNDTCTLDSNLIVLRAAAEMLARSNQNDAQAKATAANQLMIKLLSQQRAQKRDPWISGGGVYIGNTPIPYRSDIQVR